MIEKTSEMTLKARYGIRISEEATVGDDLCSYLAQGRAILNGIEAKNFQNHLKSSMGHETHFLAVSMDFMKKRDITNLVRMVNKTIIGGEHITNTMQEADLRSKMDNMIAFHGLARNLDGQVIILTDEKSSMLKQLVSNETALADAISGANVIVSNTDLSTIPVFVDEHICKQYYQDKDIMVFDWNIKRPTKRTTLDDTFTTDLQRQREQPMPLEDKLEDCIYQAKVLLSNCRDLTDNLITCPTKQ